MVGMKLSEIKIAVVGLGHLAEATSRECFLHFEMVTAAFADLVWFCVDTPVSESDEPDVDFVARELRRTLGHTRPGTPVLISSQLPVGTCAKWEKEFPEHHLIVQPENIRKAHAQADFHCQNRIIVGSRHPEDHDLIFAVLSQFCPDREHGIRFMSPESAEMVKHTLNAFLAMEIAYVNEIADICGHVGADVGDVIGGFRSDRRVSFGVQAPLTPGGPYRGGTLGRDVHVLAEVWRFAPERKGPSLVNAIRESNGQRL